jgi:hypothetical protein
MSEFTTVRAKGTCAVCGRSGLLITKKGTITRHGTAEKNVWPPENCKGYGQPPLVGGN